MSGTERSAEAVSSAVIELKCLFGRLGLLFLFSTIGVALPGTGFAQPKPVWVSQTPVRTDDGFATLRWSVEGNDSVALFRISEESSGEKQFSFTEQAEIRVFRLKPGDYSFWVQACKRYADGFPLCGEPSQRLTLIVVNADFELMPISGSGSETPTFPMTRRIAF